MMPVVAHTVADLGERPSANAFGIAVWATATFGLGRSACTHRRSIIACSCGASRRRHDARAHRGERELVGGEQVQQRQAAGDHRHGDAADARAEQDDDQHDVQQAEQEQVTVIRTWSPVSRPNDVGLGI